MTWPILMTLKTAAKACDMSERAFVQAVECGELPSPVLVRGKRAPAR